MSRMTLPPEQRHQPLPGGTPKHAAEDASVDERLKRILASPSYRLPGDDPEFIHRSEVRGVRLLLDYLKAELVLEEHGIEHTIVVFGGTRIAEKGAAHRAVEDATQALTADGSQPALTPRLSVIERLLAKAAYYDVAREFGRLVGRAGGGPTDSRVTLVTGGGPGIMEAANRGADDVDAKSVGLNISLPHEQFPNPYTTPELTFLLHYFAMRKLHFTLRAKALVAFPGGFGTMDELFTALTLIQTRIMKPIPVILVGEEYWSQVFDVGFMAAEGVIDPEDEELFWFAETAQEIWSGILDWHEANGSPLFPEGGTT